MKAIRLFILLNSMTIFGCNSQVKFDKIKWTTKEYPEAPPEQRERMIKDLTTNYKLVGMSRMKVIDLLGEPDGTDDSTFFYDITVDYGSDIDPVAGKNLELYFNSDSVVNSVKVREWKN